MTFCVCLYISGCYFRPQGLSSNDRGRPIAESKQKPTSVNKDFMLWWKFNNRAWSISACNRQPVVQFREYSSYIKRAARKSSLIPNFRIVKGWTSRNFKLQHKH